MPRSPRIALALAVALLAGCPRPTVRRDAGTDSGSESAPSISSIAPARGPTTGGTPVTVNGDNFAAGARLLFGSTDATQVTVVSSKRLTAKTPAAAAPGPVDVTVIALDGQTAALTETFAYEPPAPKAIDQALVVNDLAAEDSSGADPVLFTVISDVSVPTLTDATGQGLGVKAQVGWATALATTPQASGFTWVDTAYSADADGASSADHARDRYAAPLSLAGATGAQTQVYYFAARFSLDDGATWTFADHDGSANGVTQAQVPKLSVSRPQIGWCKLGGEQPAAPPTVSLREGISGPELYSQVFLSGVTDQAGAGAGITGQLGVGPADAGPETWTTWVDATFNRDTGNGANDELKATLPNPGPGAYAFAFRTAVAAGPYLYCDADGSGPPGFTSDQAGSLTVTPLRIDRCALQWPPAIDARVGVPIPAVYGRVWAQYVTDQPDAGAGIVAELGLGPTGVDPTSGAWTWTAATFNTDADGTAADEYAATLAAPATGSYDYAFRFSYQTGAPVLCDLDGSETGYQSAQAGKLDSKPLGIDDCRFQAPAAASAVPGGATVPLFGRVFAVGITDSPDAGAGITGEVGYGPVGSLPDGGGWTWVAASFASDQDGGASDEYQAALAPVPDAGTFDLAYRFSYAGATSYCDLDGAADGYQTAQAAKLTIAAPAIQACNLQWVSKNSLASGDSLFAFARVSVPGVTEAAGQGADVRAEAGVGTAGDNASTSAAWGWQEAAYFGDPTGTGQDEYRAELQPAYSGNRAVSFRFSLDDGASWTYCDTDGSGNGYSASNQWAISVGWHTEFDWCNTQWPFTLTQPADGGNTVYGRLKKSGLTPDAGAPIAAWLGYGRKIEDPGLAWTWLPAAFNVVVGSDMSNEYSAPLAGPDAGTWHYAFRYGYADGGGSVCYGDLNASNQGGFSGDNGAAENLGVATVTP